MRLDGLPAELIGEIINFVDLDDVAMLQATSRRMRAICRNAVLWRDLFLGTGPEHECKHAALLRKREEKAKRLAQAASAAANAERTHNSANTSAPAYIRTRPVKLRWDPVFENEPVSWYDEYIQRHAPIAVNWFELPMRTSSLGRRVGYRIDPADVLEVCGVALYWPHGVQNGCGRTGRKDREDEDDCGRLSGVPPLFAVSPLADGSVCMWDVNGTAKRRGAIVQRSAPGLLLGHAQGSGLGSPPSPSSLFTAMESVSVDSERHLAYFAMDTVLVVVDLHTLQVIGGESFAGPLTAISAAHHSVPLTVGHDSGVCLYDPRAAVSHARGAFKKAHEVVEEKQEVLFSVHESCRGKPHNFPLSSPLSILHMPKPGHGVAEGENGNEGAFSHDIFVAGRVPTIFRYDRRYMDVPKDTIFSGATLCGLSSMPYPYPKPAIGYSLLFASDDNGESEESSCYRTLIACGEYKSKGSLELYAIGSGSQQPSLPPPEPMVNRQTSSSAKILSVAAHGKRIMISDGAGFVRWFERDGFRESRRCEINGGTYAYDSYGDSEENENGNTESAATETTEMTEIVRKLLPTGIPNNASTTDFSSNDVLIWTGEHLGLITFSSQPGFSMDDFVQDLQTEEERATEKKGFEYRAKMRQLFESARYFGGDSDSDD